MPLIPTYRSQVGANELRSSNVLPNARASADDFGAGIGRALQQVAAGVDDISVGLARYRKSRQQETVANAVAQADFTPQELDIRNKVPADGTGYREQVVSAFASYVDTEADKIEDPEARKEFKLRMMSQLPSVSSRSAQYEFGVAAQFSKQQADTSIDTLRNKIMQDPTMYDMYVAQGEQVIDAQDSISPTLRDGMKLTWRQNSANARFTGMLEQAKSVADIDAISRELTNIGPSAAGSDTASAGKDWSKQFDPQQYAQLVNTIGAARKAFVTKADTDARAALDTVEARAQDLTLIPPDEMATVQSVVKQSANPITIARMARIVRDQGIIRETHTLPPAEIRARINAVNGNPGVAYPGMPPRVSSAINEATQRFDVSAGYLGGTANFEYGKYLKVKPRGDVKFRPEVTNANADLRNVRSDVVDAATVAGQMLGAPVRVVGSTKDSFDVSTAGMASAEKGRLVGALVDAGFTGIGEFDGYVRADFRNAVPASFGAKDGKVWGGWTYLSPDVVSALKDRGYAPGLSSEQVKRAGPPATDEVDYGRGTDVMIKGKPTSSAVGVMQFTNKTFVGVMRTPGVAERIGVNVAGMSDAQLLQLRADPRISIMAGAALAEQNKQALTKALGRPVSDAEVYMAHFLGSAGAVSLIKGVESQPEQSATMLLPDAARANPSMFRRDRQVLTAQELYNRIANQFSTEPSRVMHGDNETRQRVLDNAEKQVKSDPMAYAQSTGVFAVTPLNADEGFAQRGKDMRSVADYYSIPVTDMKPFTEDEANALVKQMKDGGVDDTLKVMTAIQAMGGEASRAALKQLDAKDSVFAFAAGLQFERGQSSVASDIVRGRDRIEKNPSIKDEVGADPREISDAFVKATGGSLQDADPRQRQAIQDAAMAHYVETYVARNTSKGFNQEAFTASVQAVMGGVQNAPALGSVNGETTVLPAGVTGDDVEKAFTRMTVDDWTRMGAQKLPPRYVTGDIMDPADIADEAKLRAIGGGQYKVMLSDGSFAVTGRLAQNGRMEAYIFAPNAKDIQSVASRPTAAVAAPTVPPGPEDYRLPELPAETLRKRKP